MDGPRGARRVNGTSSATRYTPYLVRTIITFSIALLALVALAGCRDGGDPEAAVLITATTPQLAEFARAVGGDRAAVTQILLPGSDPHEYEPRPSGAEALADADLVLRSGGDVDAWLDQLIEASGSGARELTLIDRVQTRSGAGEETDPHWWQDPRNAELAVAAIRDQLIAIDPGAAAGYERRARAYLTRLRALDRSIAACMDRIPASERELVTSHDALGYYADRYDITVSGAAIPSLSTQAQASAGATADLVDRIEAAGVRAIFAEQGANADLERAIAAAAGVRVGGALWTDTLGPGDSDGATYIEAMRSNTEKLAAGFTDGRDDCRRELRG